MQNNKTLFLAKNVSEILYQIKNVSGLEIVGGCTSISDLPEKALSVRDVAELKMINHHERYIDFGPAVTLNQILELDKERVPQILSEAAKSVANHFVRNMATLGGNICGSVKNPKAIKRSLYAPLLALGASLKFRNTENQMSVTVPFSKFTSVQPKQLLVNIHIPAEDWDVSVYRRSGPTAKLTEDSSAFCFLARTDQGVLSTVKIVFSGSIVFQDSELESKLLGVKLPLNQKAIQDYLAAAQTAFEKSFEPTTPNIARLKEEFLNFTRYSLNQLT
ncbi:MAG: FAD binding domain-containing protein [Treponema sp.]|nr:FAD binding domain-containing protein [Treponema sp.]